ncbi:hypothetical protein GUITHDRAFT_154754 [Guillardia theta CCMP2712]|uniref:Uncharacterized protein n=1 Tax=Guillardia theta (strain CCMP2712) TaxID=905079 RepID=L1IQT9_GUITC|nr:hypothetical protein GUITHDRAFT_154754 [Guillardia theta CCMP2712]EKX38244.1 hypothetical protein GUITHDRAFT_154754 [Guillardia theta CCMP2712]|eukprot:XP_005825224.1 hypothetical protein GUITHDRAFT_154754 [Guillardia theta CCMP2712]
MTHHHLYREYSPSRSRKLRSRGTLSNSLLGPLGLKSLGLPPALRQHDDKNTIINTNLNSDVDRVALDR